MSTIRRVQRIGAIVFAVVLVVAVGFWLTRHELLRRYEGLPAFSHSQGATERYDVAMRDGAKLATTVYRPEGEGPWPAVLIRNPYQGFDIVVRNWCGLLVRYGYACVYQDVRGQGESEGEWEPLLNERDDGIDTLAWLTGQAFQNANIAMMGPSYLGGVQWAVAGDLPPEVKTLVPAVITTRAYDTQYYNGMFRHETFTAWSAMMPKRGMNRGAGDEYQQAIRHRPHNEVDEKFFGGKIDWYQAWISSPSRSDPYWQQEISKIMQGNPERTRVPVLMIGGWYDIFFGPQFEDWSSLASRTESRFIIGPWTHSGQGGDAIDMKNAGGGLTQWKVVLDWFGHHLKGEPLENRPGVASYRIGDNQWIERETFPPPTRPLRLHLDADGDPKACNGARMAEQPPAREKRANFRYDPDDPVPTRGGSGMLAFILPGFGGAPPANVWQGDLCMREDILSFRSEPFGEALDIAGAISLSLTVASDAEDTSFTVKLVEVFSDGRAVNIRDGITTLAYRRGDAAPLPYTPGERTSFELDLWPIEWQVQAGSRLRLDVSSSDFPKYHAHPNRAGIWSAQAEAIPANQQLFTGPMVSSWLELPVVTP
ncbi:MAG: CocE/NonD family hydrolase [bacterium]|nr:CocE/NonD family hydrolase [bacterium]